MFVEGADAGDCPSYDPDEFRIDLGVRFRFLLRCDREVFSADIGLVEIFCVLENGFVAALSDIFMISATIASSLG